ncbi:hypothetical protein ABIA39_003434 [Nocardia sp. GAS34]|uniref:hypothetical protein n=1 Tax=unclassified Nocardia TaxID=2637762 RepID=UPI003D23070A
MVTDLGVRLHRVGSAEFMQHKVIPLDLTADDSLAGVSGLANELLGLGDTEFVILVTTCPRRAARFRSYIGSRTVNVGLPAVQACDDGVEREASYSP